MNNETCNCGTEEKPSTAKGIVRINYKEDFELVVELLAGDKPYKLGDEDFRIDFIVMASRYTVGRTAGVCERCAVDGNKVRCFMDSHGLPPGELHAEVKVNTPNPNYADGSRLSVAMAEGTVLLVNGNTRIDGAVVKANIPVALVDAYQLAKEHGYKGTIEEYYATFTEIGHLKENIKGTLDEMTEAERLRADAETERAKAETERQLKQDSLNDAEGERVKNEQQRNATETERVAAEKQRNDTEQARKKDEQQRQTNEDARKQAETERATAEIAREKRTGEEGISKKIAELNRLPVIKTETETVELLPNVEYEIHVGTALNLSLASPTDTEVINEYHGSFDTGAQPPTIVWPANVSWESPLIIDGGRHYEFSIRHTSGKYYGLLLSWKGKEN